MAYAVACTPDPEQHREIPLSPALAKALDGHIRSRVIAVLETQNHPELLKYFFCQMGGILALIPCLWFHLIVASPCICGAAAVAKGKALKQYFVLTEREVLCVQLDADDCCCPGVSTSGTQVKAVPLEQLTDIGTDQKGKGCGRACVPDLPIVHLDTASGNRGPKNCGHEARMVSVDEAAARDFKRLALDQRDKVRGGVLVVGGTPAVAQMQMDVPSAPAGPSPEERLAKITDLQAKGILTDDEFQAKRQEIIASM